MEEGRAGICEPERKLVKMQDAFVMIMLNNIIVFRRSSN